MAHAAAFTIHILTASGAALALLAAMAASGHAFAWMFAYFGAALIVDGIDGPLARRFNVSRKLPRWSGESLDLVVDFTTYVFVPAYAIAVSGLMPTAMAVASGGIVVITGALYFADREMKTADNAFKGFPAVWNVAAFYLFVFQPPGWICFGGVVGLAALTFAPINFVHPLRVERWRTFSIAMLILWSILAIVAIWHNLAPSAWVAYGLGVAGVYFLLSGLIMQRLRT